MMKILKILKIVLNCLVTFAFSLIILGASSIPPADQIERVRIYTRNIEFDYVSWTMDALWLKVSQVALGTSQQLSPDRQHQLVEQYLQLVGETSQLNRKITTIFADPKVGDPTQASQELRQDLEQKKERMEQLTPVAEAILQTDVASIAYEQGLTLGGQPVPPVLYHSTDLPLALILSPRNKIHEEDDVSLQPGMNAKEMDDLERRVLANSNLSALVVPVGGIGIYPTMVDNTTDLNWLAEVISHEWTHNYLTLRPLGVSYMGSPELRTMNETTATLVGHELGRAVIRRYFPERVPPPAQENPPPPSPQEPPKFNFQAEMHKTRVATDDLLLQKRINDAETYMESRRQFFWDNGYQIRKINQAYFAFYGAYNDVSAGGGATGQAGSDPVGPAVVALRQKSASLADFLNRISWMVSFDQLKKAVQ
jgi:hypothetical protein